MFHIPFIWGGCTCGSIGGAGNDDVSEGSGGDLDGGSLLSCSSCSTYSSLCRSSVRPSLLALGEGMAVEEVDKEDPPLVVVGMDDDLLLLPSIPPLLELLEVVVLLLSEKSEKMPLLGLGLLLVVVRRRWCLCLRRLVEGWAIGALWDKRRTLVVGANLSEEGGGGGWMGWEER